MVLASLPRNFEQIRRAANSQVASITLGHLMRNTKPDAASLLSASQWLQEQLPTRFARRIEAFLHLPHVVVSNRHVLSVLESHLETFSAVSAFPPIQGANDEAMFCELIREQLAIHKQGTRLIAEGYREVRHAYPSIFLDEFLDAFFVQRIASRILMENYVQMRMPKSGFVGVVEQGMHTLSVIQAAADQLVDLTRSVYGRAPRVEYRGNLDCLLDYIPRHVWYMVRELLKNALRATMERHGNKSSLPPVFVELQKGDMHVIIKISDQGGGMTKDLQQQAWHYGWTTAEEEEEGPKRELAGDGIGLPLTRLHAQYFGGDVFMQAIPGHGTNVYLLLTHLKEGTPSTEIDDLSTVLYREEGQGRRLH